MATDRDEPLDPRLREAIATLRDSAPAEDLWPAIAPRLAPRRPAGTLLIRWPAALAAGLVIAMASAGGTLLMLRERPAVPVASAPTTTTTTLAALTPADAALQQAITQLEQQLREGATGLDDDARDAIERSLAALDRAVAEAAAQLRAAPDDAGAARYLTATLQRKLDALRTVTQRTAVRTS